MVRRLEGEPQQRVPRRIAETMPQPRRRDECQAPGGAVQPEPELDIDIVDEEILAHGADLIERGAADQAAGGDGKEEVIARGGVALIGEPAACRAPAPAREPVARLDGARLLHEPW